MRHMLWEGTSVVKSPTCFGVLWRASLRCTSSLREPALYDPGWHWRVFGTHSRGPSLGGGFPGDGCPVRLRSVRLSPTAAEPLAREDRPDMAKAANGRMGAVTRLPNLPSKRRWPIGLKTALYSTAQGGGPDQGHGQRFFLKLCAERSPLPPYGHRSSQGDINIANRVPESGASSFSSFSPFNPYPSLG